MSGQELNACFRVKKAQRGPSDHIVNVAAPWPGGEASSRWSQKCPGACSRQGLKAYVVSEDRSKKQRSRLKRGERKGSGAGFRGEKISSGTRKVFGMRKRTAEGVIRLKKGGASGGREEESQKFSWGVTRWRTLLSRIREPETPGRIESKAGRVSAKRIKDK